MRSGHMQSKAVDQNYNPKWLQMIGRPIVAVGFEFCVCVCQMTIKLHDVFGRIRCNTAIMQW